MSIFTFFKSPLGEILLVAKENKLNGIWFVKQKHYPSITADYLEDKSLKNKILATSSDELKAYFSGKLKTFSIPTATMGTDFQKKVWDFIAKIPYGQSLSYGQIAKEINSSPRAVGSAVGRNPISIIIPCHRVLGHKGEITGYASGLDKKEALLKLEKIKYKK